MLLNWRNIRRTYWPTKLTWQKTDSAHKHYTVATYDCSPSEVGWEKDTRISVLLGEKKFLVIYEYFNPL